jgi:transketolase
VTVIAVGPLAGTYLDLIQTLPDNKRPNLWAVAELPISKNPLPNALLKQITNGLGVYVAEEHVARGGFGSELALYLAEQGINTVKFQHLCARSHLYEAYGSQNYLRKESGIDAAQLIAHITST